VTSRGLAGRAGDRLIVICFEGAGAMVTLGVERPSRSDLYEKNEMRETHSTERKCGRFVIPGATITFTTAKFWNKLDSVLERSPVVDISRQGISFLTDTPPKSRRISITLLYCEDEAPLHMLGQVVYVLPRGAGLSYRYRIGVAFDPFSKRKDQNSLEASNKLYELERIYLTDKLVSKQGNVPLRQENMNLQRNGRDCTRTSEIDDFA